MAKHEWFKDEENSVVFEGTNFITRVTGTDDGRYWFQGMRRKRPTSPQLCNKVQVGEKGESSVSMLAIISWFLAVIVLSK